MRYELFPGVMTLWCEAHNPPLNITRYDNKCFCNSTAPYALIHFTGTKLSLRICSSLYVNTGRLIICCPLILMFLKIFRYRKELAQRAHIEFYILRFISVCENMCLTAPYPIIQVTTFRRLNS